MAQKIFQSFRRIPGNFPTFRKKAEQSDLQGSKHKVSIKKLVTLTDSDDLYLWELASSGQTSSQLVQRSCLKRITSQLRSQSIGIGGTANSEENSHVTAMYYASESQSILIGCDNGWVAPIRLNTNSVTNDYTKFWCAPSVDDGISPSRVLDRPGFPGQLLIGYNSGLSVLFDLRSNRLMTYLPWQHGLESAAWCGGNGKPHNSKPPSHSPHLGTRLLAAHTDGSLGVWSFKDIGFPTITSTPVQATMLSMEEPPSMPYGKFLTLLLISIQKK
ncbi:unnamed protein product [Trichobilharzia regenti]|nr:unnamed protein product [Trichobilharzia regenti]